MAAVAGVKKEIHGETPIPVELLPQQNRNFSRARPFIKGCALPNTWKDGASDVGTDQDRERYRVKVAFLISIRFQPPIHP
jgi:hypothetical protein